MDACSLPVLLGLRVLLTSSISLVREHFPRLQRQDLLRHLGMAVLEPAGDEQVEALVELGRFDLLRDAAAGAVAAPDLTGRKTEVVAARTALVQVLAKCCSTARIGEVVQRRLSQVRHLKHCRPAQQLVRAVRLQICQRSWLVEHHPELADPAPSRLPQFAPRPNMKRSRRR